MLEMLKILVKEEEGQGMVEYGLILALISVVVIATLGFIGDELLIKFEEVLDSLKGTPTT